MLSYSRCAMLAAALFVAAPLAAQQASLDASVPVTVSAVVAMPAPVAASTASVGPVLQPAAVSVRTNTAPAAMLPAQYGDNSQNVALMVVGGAGLIVGAVIGGRSGTIVMLGSGILGLVGLFRYLQ
ncbi:MAG TPA: hypothetical protein VMV51_04430 [Gemmatimonadaceae bacterium]|nr:hypothetical protein [Gemmatimonadaceae bacterium]